MGRFSSGQIVEAHIGDRHGRVKQRPALIISTNAECDQGEVLRIIAISTKFRMPLPDYHIAVHKTYRRDPDSGLERPSVAKCNWVREIKQASVIRSLGWMPDELFDSILDAYDRIDDDPKFTDWQ